MKEGSEGRGRRATEGFHPQRGGQGACRTVHSSAVWRDFNLCKTYRGRVSAKNLRHSSRRVEKGTSNPRRLHVLPPFDTESTIFRARGCFEKLGTKNHKQFCLENLVPSYQRSDLQILKRFFEGEHYSGFLDSRAFENITEYFDSHIRTEQDSILGQRRRLY